MNATVLRRFLIAGAVGTGFLAQPSESQAIFHWFKSCCQPAVPCAQPVQVAQYVPQTAYRTQYVNVPVTTMRPISSCGPCGGTQVSYMPVTTMTTQAQLVPYTTYRIVYSNVVAAQPMIPVQPVVANYAVPVATAAPVATVVPATPVAPTGCSSCGGGGAPVAASTYYRAPTTTAYSAYSAPVYNGAGFGPPSAGMPLDNSAGNLMQSATTGSSLRGVAPTVSSSSPYASGATQVAPTVPMPAQPQMNQGQIIQAPAAAQPQMQMQQQPMQQQQSAPIQSSPAQPNGSSGASPQTYANEPATNGTNGAARPVTPNYPSAPPYNGTAPTESAPPIQPIPHEEPNGTSVDPTSGPSIFPPASRTTQAPANQSWAYTRLSYLPGESSVRQVEKIPTTTAVDTRPAVSSDGWRASSR